MQKFHAANVGSPSGNHPVENCADRRDLVDGNGDLVGDAEARTAAVRFSVAAVRDRLDWRMRRRMSFCSIPDSREAAVIAAISFVLASVASLTVFALLVTPPRSVRNRAARDTAFPFTITRASGRDGSCCACACMTPRKQQRRRLRSETEIETRPGIAAGVAARIGTVIAASIKSFVIYQPGSSCSAFCGTNKAQNEIGRLACAHDYLPVSSHFCSRA